LCARIKQGRQDVFKNWYGSGQSKDVEEELDTVIPAQELLTNLTAIRTTLQRVMIETRGEVDEKARRVERYVQGVDKVRDIAERHRPA
jgi:hypothetical protein